VLTSGLDEMLCGGVPLLNIRITIFVFIFILYTNKTSRTLRLLVTQTKLV